MLIHHTCPTSPVFLKLTESRPHKKKKIKLYRIDKSYKFSIFTRLLPSYWFTCNLPYCNLLILRVLESSRLTEFLAWYSAYKLDLRLFPIWLIYHTHISCDHAAPWMVQSVRLSVCLFVCHTFSLCTHHRIIMRFYEALPMAEVMSMQKVRVRGQRSRSQRSKPNFVVSGPWLQSEFTYGNEMMHNAWCCLGEVPYFLFKVIHQILSSHGSQNRRFWLELSFSVP